MLSITEQKYISTNYLVNVFLSTTLHLVFLCKFSVKYPIFTVDSINVTKNASSHLTSLLFSILKTYFFNLGSSDFIYSHPFKIVILIKCMNCNNRFWSKILQALLNTKYDVTFLYIYHKVHLVIIYGEISAKQQFMC